MKLQFGPLLVVVTILSAPLAQGQVGSGDSSQSGSTSSSSQSSDGPQAVYTPPQDRPSLDFLDEATAHNFVKVGLGASLGYDTNAAVFSPNPYSQTQGIFTPSFQLTQTRPEVNWYVGAIGSLTTSSIPGYYTTSSPSAQAGVLWQVTQRWQLNIKDNYLYTADPFQQYVTYNNTPTYNQPNPTAYAPLVTTESNYGSVDLTYLMGAHDSVTFGGTQSFVRYLHDNYNPYNLYAWGGSGSYQHVFSPRFSAGGAYSYQTLDFGHGQSRSGIQQIQVYGSYQINTHMIVTGWFGPEYTSTKNLVPILCTPSGCFIEEFHNSSWSSAYGGTFVYRGLRNAATVNFSKSISNGGILLGIVQLYYVSANYNRQLDPRWTLNLSTLYGNNTGYSTRLHYQHLNSLSAYASVTRQITPALSASLQYVYFYQTQKNLYGASEPKWTDNRFQITLQYTWGHSLGR